MDRAAWGSFALNSYAEHKWGKENYDTLPEMLSDLVCDLMHLMTLMNVPIDQVFTAARGAYEEEMAMEIDAKGGINA